eukprot:TRINITY_DN790_c0_g1_i1.p1 TRINITY_DN790_c0_g1~~TRINITY_DN790_c0_g1_i1.p1  ORF type:complete len:175 (+),score=44.47 TRINITY_DN790_c0_g1_i1:310-834(+)
MGASFSSNGNGYSNFPLHDAVKNSDAKLVEMLITKGSLVNARDKEDVGYTPLQYAIQKNDLNLVRILLQNSALIDKRGGQNSQTGLHIAIEYDASLPLVEELIKHGCDIDSKDCRGNTPLHYAAFHGRISILKILLNIGAAVTENYTSMTPLDLARQENCPNCIQILSIQEKGN